MVTSSPKYRISARDFVPTAARQRVGITCMTERARQLNDSLDIENRPGSGTPVRLPLPVQS